MADIKIRRVVKGSVKTLDRAKTLGERMRGATIRTKDKAENSVNTHESSSEEYAANKVESAVEKGAREGAQQFDSQGKKAVRDTKENVEVLRYRIKNRTAKKKADPKAKDAAKTVKKTKSSAKTAKRSTHKAGSTADTMNKTAKTAKSIPKTASRTAKGSIKTSRYTVKVSQKSIKTASKTGKAAIKTAEKSAKATKAAAKASAKAARAAAKAARVAVKVTIKGIKLAVKAIVSAVKAIIAGVKALVSAIIAGGWIAVVIIIIIALIALIVGSCFGIFFSNEDTGSEYSMQSVITELDEEFHTQIENTISTHPHDVLERSGATAAWEEVLSVYSVKTTTDPDDAADVASIDDGKKAIIREVFWLMNTINARTESRTETVVYETIDIYGNVVRTEVVVTKVYLIITVTHKTAEEMVDHYGFTSAQRAQLAELLSEENRGMWDAVLAGVR